jgi:plastocyanin
MRHIGVFLMIAAFAVLAGPAAADNSQLQASVGPGFTISLKDASGAKVTHLDPGTYAIHVIDQSDMHNFDLTGPGVSKSTEVTEVGEQDWTVTFTDGTYRYVCDVHATSMKGSFTVGNVPTTTVLKMSASVGPGQKIAFARTAKAGKTTITIRDLTAKDNFHLTGPGVNKKTGVAFKGTVKWTVTLKAGTYTYRSDAHKGLKGTLKVKPAA